MEIEQLERKASASKMYSEDPRYPKVSRDRFLKKYEDQREQLRDLNRRLKKAIEDPDNEEDLDVRRYASLEDIEYDNDTIPFKEIDLSDNKDALVTLDLLYPEGLED